MFTGIFRFFDRLEDGVRVHLSHRSFIYAFIGGTCTVLFWRGIWHTGDILMSQGGFWGWLFYEPFTVVWTSLIMLLTGLFVSIFIGDRIVISGLKKEKKITERTEDEVQKEENRIKVISAQLASVLKELEDIKNELAKK